ncbi:MAG: YncE family protein, partial [Bacteroidales bacterium]
MSVAPCMAQQDTSYIILENTIVLQNISGRLGHMAYSAKQGTIYLAALSNNTLEVIDLQDKKTIKSIKSLRQPVDVEYLPGSNVVLVACLGDGLCRAFNASTYKEETSFRFDQNVSLVKYN